MGQEPVSVRRGLRAQVPACRVRVLSLSQWGQLGRHPEPGAPPPRNLTPCASPPRLFLSPTRGRLQGDSQTQVGLLVHFSGKSVTSSPHPIHPWP